MAAWLNISNLIAAEVKDHIQEFFEEIRQVLNARQRRLPELNFVTGQCKHIRYPRTL